MNYIHSLINNIGITNSRFAHLLCTIIPPTCPIERDISFFGHYLFHIPPMCQLNPFYEDLISLRFKALTYLADHQEDISYYV